MNNASEEKSTFDQVANLALNLTPPQQALLLARLYDNLESLGHDAEHEAAWAAEIERRIREIDSGEAVLIDHEVVMREVSERLER